MFHEKISSLFAPCGGKDDAGDTACLSLTDEQYHFGWMIHPPCAVVVNSNPRSVEIHLMNSIGLHLRLHADHSEQLQRGQNILKVYLQTQLFAHVHLLCLVESLEAESFVKLEDIDMMLKTA